MVYDSVPARDALRAPHRTSGLSRTPQDAGHPMKLSAAQIDEKLKALPEWSLVGENIQRTFVFKDFLKSMTFVNKVADRAEAVQHHPDILVRWNKVTLTLSTHDAGGISQKDFDLAADCEQFAREGTR